MKPTARIIFEGQYPKRYAIITCPGCKGTATIDKDQYEGRVSIECPMPGCGYHETHDLAHGTAEG